MTACEHKDNSGEVHLCEQDMSVDVSKSIIRLRSLDKDDFRLTSRENHKDSATKGEEVN